MKEVLDDLEKGKFVRTQVTGSNEGFKNRESQGESINDMNKGRLVETDDYIKF